MTPAELRDAVARATTTPALAHLVTAALDDHPPPPPPPGWSLYRLYRDTGDRRRYETVYFARRGHLNAAALAALADPTPTTLDRLADALWSTCDEWTWALPAHAHLVDGTDRDMTRCVDLFAAETGHTLAEIVALLGDHLPAPVTRRVRTEVHRRVLHPYFADPRPWRWETARTNWSAVCAGAAGMAALALWPDSPRLTAALGRCRSALTCYLSGLTADGGCPEGLDYWVYGFGYFTYFAEALRARTGDDLLAASPRVTAAARFPAAVQLAAGRFVTFSDTTDSPLLPTGLLCRLADRLDTPLPTLRAVPGLDADPCHRWAHLSRNLAWTDPARLDGPPPPPGSAWLPHLAWLVDRRRVDRRLVAFAAKGGHNAEPHNHNDLGHFLLATDGEQLLVDLGAGEYSADYFGHRRYTHLHPSAQGHSVPVVDGRDQRAGRDAAATVRHVHHGPDGADLALDLSAAYGTQVRRHFAWRPDGHLTLTDDVPDATEVEELFISRAAPHLEAGTAHWRGRTGHASLRFDPDTWQPTVERVDTRDHHGRPEVVHRLRLRATTPPRRARFTLTVR